VALARDGVVSRSRQVLPYLNRASGALLLVAGLYITWYGYVEIRVLGGDLVADGPVGTVAGWASAITTFADRYAAWLALVAGTVIVAGLVRWLVNRRGAAASTPDREEVR
jgi:hypothetical protein